MYTLISIFLLFLCNLAWSADPPLTLYDEGVKQGVIFKIDCVGAGVACTKSGITGTATIGGGAGAPSDADYLVGTANGSLSAEIVVGTTPGGELGNTWASPTLDDSVTVTGWAMGDSTANTPAENDNDTSLATTAYVQTEISGFTASGWTDGGTNVYLSTTTDKVGLGTTTPKATLEVLNQSSSPYLMVSSTATSNGDILVITSNGNVGIGTASAGEKFAVGTQAFRMNSNGQITRFGGTAVTIDGTQFSGSNSGSTVTLQNSSSTSGSSTLVIGSAATNGFLSLRSTSGTGSGDQIRLQGGTNGATRLMTLLGTGNVGVGTVGPTSLFQVNGGDLAVGLTSGFANGGAGNDLYVSGNMEVDGTIYGDGSGLTGASGLTAAGGWTDGGANVYVSTTTDNVGIGTTTPSTTLEIVKQGSNPLLMISSVPTGNGDFLIVKSDGKVGIGTINPTHELQIVGSQAGIDLDATADTEKAIITFRNSLAVGDEGVAEFGLNEAEEGVGFRYNVVGNGYAWFGTNDTQRLSIAADGNVGIGTATAWPGKFTITGATAGQAACFTTGGRMGVCSSAVGAGGGCTCTGI